MKKVKISYCNGKKCKRKNEGVKAHLKAFVTANDLEKKVKIEKSKCKKLCKLAPVVCIKKQQCFGVEDIQTLDNLIKVK